MRYWWEFIYHTDWKKYFRDALRQLPREKSSLKMLERRLALTSSPVTPNYNRREENTERLPSSSVEKLVEIKERLLEEIRLLAMHINDLEDALSSLPQIHQDFINYRYFEQMDRSRVCDQLQIQSESEYETIDVKCLEGLKESLIQVPLF